MLSSEKYVKLMKQFLKRFLLTRAGTQIASLTRSHLPRSTEDIYRLSRSPKPSLSLLGSPSHSGSVLPTSPFMALGKKQSSHKAANVAGGCSDPVGVASTRTEAVREPVPLPASPPARTQGDEIAGAGTQRSWSIPWDHFPSPRQSPVKHQPFVPKITSKVTRSNVRTRCGISLNKSLD